MVLTFWNVFVGAPVGILFLGPWLGHTFGRPMISYALLIILYWFTVPILIMLLWDWWRDA
jgi:hypothetical protein